MKVYEIIKARAKEAGAHTEVISVAVGASPPSVRHWLGGRRAMSVRTLALMCDALNLCHDAIAVAAMNDERASITDAEREAAAKIVEAANAANARRPKRVEK